LSGDLSGGLGTGGAGKRHTGKGRNPGHFD
jgi:hypothetical protein